MSTSPLPPQDPPAGPTKTGTIHGPAQPHPAGGGSSQRHPGNGGLAQPHPADGGSSQRHPGNGGPAQPHPAGGGSSQRHPGNGGPRQARPASGSPPEAGAARGPAKAAGTGTAEPAKSRGTAGRATSGGTVESVESAKPVGSAESATSGGTVESATSGGTVESVESAKPVGAGEAAKPVGSAESATSGGTGESAKAAGTAGPAAGPDGTAGHAGQRPRLGSGFVRLWTASTASAIGDGVSLTAAPLLASTLTDDPRLVAGVTMALTLPYALFGIPAGVLVDRTELRRAMLGIDFFRGTLMLLLSLSLAYGWAGLPVLYVCFFLIGTCETFFRNASQVIVPSVVPEERLVEANGRLMGAQNAANQFVGPLLGSALFPLARAVPFALDAVSFYVSAGLLTSLRITCRPAAKKTGRNGLLGDMLTGAAWLVRHRMLRNLAVTAGLLNLVITGGLAVLVVHARGVLHLGDTGYGLLLACQAVGAVLAARLSPELTRRAGPGWSLVLVALAISAANVVVWLVPSGWAVGPALALTACAGVTWDVVVVVKRQTLIPKELQGRVNSVYRLLAWGAMPIGAGLAGVLSKAAGTPTVFAAGAAVTAAMAVRLGLGVRAGWLTETGGAGTPEAAGSGTGGQVTATGPGTGAETGTRDQAAAPATTTATAPATATETGTPDQPAGAPDQAAAEARNQSTEARNQPAGAPDRAEGATP